jgi:hypothetical protein
MLPIRPTTLKVQGIKKSSTNCKKSACFKFLLNKSYQYAVNTDALYNISKLKSNNQQQMHNAYIIFTTKNLVHVSTPLGHLQGEQFYYTRIALNTVV